MYLYLIFFILGLLVLTRIIKKRTWFLFAINCWFWIWVLLLFLPSFRVFKMIREDTVPGLFEWGIFIPLGSSVVKALFSICIPFLMGIYFIRKRFLYWKFVLGAILGIAILGILIEQPHLTIKTIIHWKNLRLVFTILFYTLLIRLPFQRAAFERLLGFPIQSGKFLESSASGSFSSEFLSHATLLQIFIIIVLMIITGHYERKLSRMLSTEGPAPIYRSPALKNAYDDYKELFTKKTSPKIPISLDDSSTKLLSPLPARLWEKEWKDFDEKSITGNLERISPYIQALEKAKTADYCIWYEPHRKMIMPDFLNFRETSRFLGIRAVMKMYHNQKAEALEDMETLLHTAWLLNTDGPLVSQMLGVPIRWIGLDLAYSYFLKYRNDPSSLLLLENMLQRMGPKIRISFDVEGMRRYEPALWPIVPYPEISAPGFKRAYINYYSSWLKFDEIILCLALERYKQEHQRYPDNLEELLASFLERIPLDPYQGKPYIYEKKDDSFTIKCHLEEDPNVKNKFKIEPTGLILPYSKVDNPE